MEASVRTRQIGSATYRIALTGGFHMYTAPGVQARPARLHSDSTFLGVLLVGVKSLRERRGEISVACPGSVRKIFELAGLDRVLTIVEAPAVAVETFA